MYKPQEHLMKKLPIKTDTLAPIEIRVWVGGTHSVVDSTVKQHG